MEKNSKKYKETGGWSFERFRGDTRERVVKICTANALAVIFHRKIMIMFSVCTESKSYITNVGITLRSF